MTDLRKDYPEIPARPPCRCARLAFPHRRSVGCDAAEVQARFEEQAARDFDTQQRNEWAADRGADAREINAGRP